MTARCNTRCRAKRPWRLVGLARRHPAFNLKIVFLQEFKIGNIFGRMSDPYDLERFVAAQAQVYAQVVAELSDGRKRSHWMWFIFPQIAGLGFSTMAQRFAIRSRAEAAAYLAHNILGPPL